MRYLLIIGFVSFCINIQAQHYFFGDQQSLYGFDAAVYSSDSNNHSIVKPYNYKNLIKQKINDSVFQKGLWPYSSFINSRKITILPLVDYSFQNNYLDDERIVSGGVGLQVNGSFTNRFSFQARYLYREGAISGYQINGFAKRLFTPGLGLIDDTSKNSYKLHDLDMFIAFDVNKYITLSAGKGKSFWGDGYRSLFLSDYAPSYPFLKIESEFWNVKYVNLYSMHEDYYYYGHRAKKFSSSHILSWNVHKGINFSIFESVVWQAKDTLSNRNFDVNYLNPFIFFRPVEYSIGSSDNSFLGANIKFRIFKRHIFYGQVLFDEFYLSELRAGDGWWANKYGVQFGYKTFDLLNISGLGAQIEYNSVRPYTYSHVTSLQNYAHLNQSLAHPLESNFKELLVKTSLQRKNFAIYLQYTYQVYGTDSLDLNYGGNMFLGYGDHKGDDYGHFTTQGEKNTVNYYGVKLSYMLMPKSNTKAILSVDYRTKQIKSKYLNSFLISIGISSSLWNTYSDY